MARILTVLTGFGMIAAGVHLGGLPGVLLMIAGLVPGVLGVANVSVLREIRDERAHRREQTRRAYLRHDGVTDVERLAH